MRIEGSAEKQRNSRLGVRLGIFLLRARYLPSDDILSYIVLLAQVEELPDLGCTLRTKALREDVVGQSWDVTITLLDDDKREYCNIGTDDAATDRLALALTGATSTVARVPIGEEQTNTVGKQDTLLHGKPLLVVSTRYTKDVTFEFITQSVGLDFLSDFLLIKDAARGW